MNADEMLYSLGFLKVENNDGIGYYDSSGFPLNYCGTIVFKNGQVFLNVILDYYDINKLMYAIECKKKELNYTNEGVINKRK